MLRQSGSLLQRLVRHADQAGACTALPSLTFCQHALTSLVGAFHTSPAGRSALAELSVPEPPPPPVVEALEADSLPQADMTPRQVVEQLDRFIVGQADAKRAVAVALRNRLRRHKLSKLLRDEIMPRSMLMIGPTGCGKTEIARRLAKLADAPFVKVEATKFTEVGFHGRDVDQIIRDLVDAAMLQTRAKLQRQARAQIEEAIEEKIIGSMVGAGSSGDTKETFTRMYREGKLDERQVVIDVPPQKGANPLANLGEPGQGMAVQQMIISVDRLLTPRQGKGDKRKMKVSEARQVLREAEADRLISADTVQREAITAVEQDGIVFIDEIDKITSSADTRYGADASSEGVQRDLLPIIEGCQVTTKYGTVSTDHILFICSGAFHSCKPSDMLAELQGRLPIRVELKGLTAADFVRILTEPEHNMIRQQQALLGTEGIDLRFTPEAIQEIAAIAEQVNSTVDNIGARRLHTVLERIIEEISFDAPDLAKAQGHGEGNPLRVDITRPLVQERLRDLLQSQDLSKYIL